GPGSPGEGGVVVASGGRARATWRAVTTTTAGAILRGMPTADIGLLGAGPAGARPYLIHHAVFPRPKPCGEGVMPAGRELLREFGVLDRLLAAGGVPLEGLVFHVGAVALRGPFCSPGLGIPRDVLDHALRARGIE